MSIASIPSGIPDVRISPATVGRNGACAAAAAALTVVGPATTILGVVVWPWLLAGTWPGAQWWLAILASGLLGLSTLVVLLRPQTARAPRIAWLILLAMLLGTLQTIRLPAPVLACLAPRSAQLWQEYGDPLATGFDRQQSANTISLHPAGTRRELAKLWIAAVFVISGWTFFATERTRIWLIGAVALNGVALTLFAFLQKAMWNGHIYWHVPSPSYLAFGPFINHNNAGGYLLVCLGCLAGLIAWRLHDRTPTAAIVALGSQRLTVQARLGSYRRWLGSSIVNVLNDPATMAAMLGVVVLVAGVMVTLSRGAFLGMLATAGGFAVIVARRRSPTGIIAILVLGVAAWSLIAWLQQFERVQNRLSTLLDGSQLSSARVLHLQDAIGMIPDFVMTGCGIGAYRYVNDLYRSTNYAGWFQYVENQYLETLLVGGCLGAMLLGLACYVFCRDAWRLSKTYGRSNWSIAVMGICIFGGQLAAAAFDFAWYIPANMILLASLVGVVQRTAGAGKRARKTEIWLLCAALVACGCFAVRETRRLATVEAALCAAPLREESAPAMAAEPHQLRAEIAGLEQALQLRADDERLLQRLSKKYIRLARVNTYHHLASQSPSTPTSALWMAASLAHVNRTAHGLACTGDTIRFEALRCQSEALTSLAQAHTYLQRALSACPLLADANYDLAQLDLLVTGRAATWRRYIRRAMKLAPHHASLKYAAGLMHLYGGQQQLGCDLLRESIETHGVPDPRMLAVACELLPPDEFAVHVLPADPARLCEIADKFFNSPFQGSFRQAIGERMRGLLAADTRYPDRQFLLARALEHAGDFSSAEKQLQRAIKYSPKRASAHFHLASVLEQQGRLQEAAQQAAICAALEPQSERYENYRDRIEKTAARAQR